MTLSEGIPICRTMAECMAHEGERVHVVGIYTVWDPLPERKRDHPPPQQVMIELGDGDGDRDGGEGPYLEAWGHEGHFRSLDEIARFQGKRVRVTGRFLRRMPPPSNELPDAASLGGSCIHPVESVTLAE